MNKDIIIYEQYGGLGDNLQFSTLPEEFSKLGYNVYIHTSSKFKNKEIFDLIWGKNPYIKGFMNKTPNAGTNKWWPSNIPQHENNSFIETVELRHGLNKNNKYPKLYYTPNLIEELKDTIIIDLNADAQKSNIINNINKFHIEINKQTNDNDKIKVINYINLNFNNKTLLNNYDSYECDNIYKLCDIIFSCKTFICTYSGTSVLASAIKHNNTYPNIKCLSFDRNVEPWHIFGFPNIEYINILP
jgi:hypothetical protein